MRELEVIIKLKFSKDGECVDIVTNSVPHTVIIESLQTVINGLSESLVKEARSMFPEIEETEKYLDARIKADRDKLEGMLSN